MRRCLRSIPHQSFFLPRFRPLHSTRHTAKESSLPDEVPDSGPRRTGRTAIPDDMGDPIDPLGQFEPHEKDWNYRWSDYIKDRDYAEEINKKSLARWEESQDPRGQLQFMSLGREFRLSHGLSQMSQMSLNHQRELRAYYRKMMYEMPQFRQFARPFRPPTKNEVLQFRYTSYLGANHPAQKKVVLQFRVKNVRNALRGDPRVDDAWEHKFKLLLGTRYDPTTDMVRMSCDQHPYPAQNKRWLSDKIDELIELAATGDGYGDIPIDDRHVKKKRTFKMPSSWLTVPHDKRRADKAIQDEIFQPALAKAISLSGFSALSFPEYLARRLKGIVTATVYNAVRPGVYADLNDPRVREHIVNESLKGLVRNFDKRVATQADFITPDISEEEFQALFKQEQERLKQKDWLDSLRARENEAEELHRRREEFAEKNVGDELDEITSDERESVEKTAKEGDAERMLDIDGSALDAKMVEALKIREQRRKMILSRLDEPEVPEWLKHAVDTEDKEYFPMASGRFNSEKLSREDVLADFFQRELDDAKYGSEKEAKLMELLEDFIEQENNEMVEEEPVEAVKRRVNAVLKEIEDREEVKNAQKY